MCGRWGKERDGSKRSARQRQTKIRRTRTKGARGAQLSILSSLPSLSLSLVPLSPPGCLAVVVPRCHLYLCLQILKELLNDLILQSLSFLQQKLGASNRAPLNNQLANNIGVTLHTQCYCSLGSTNGSWQLALRLGVSKARVRAALEGNTSVQGALA